MLLTVGLALGVLSLGLTLRWAVHRVDALGRPEPFPVVGAAMPLVLAVVVAVPAIRHAQLESRLSGVATRAVGHAVTVRCQTLGDTWLSAHPERGYVRFDADGVPEPVAVITYDTCRTLGDWVRSNHRSASLEEVIAVHVLTHEIMHLTGVADEAIADCRAVQRDAATARQLGAPAAVGADIARRYYAEVQPQLPEAYRSADCRAGGALDERLADTPWA